MPRYVTLPIACLSRYDAAIMLDGCRFDVAVFFHCLREFTLRYRRCLLLLTYCAMMPRLPPPRDDIRVTVDADACHYMPCTRAPLRYIAMLISRRRSSMPTRQCRRFVIYLLTRLTLRQLRLSRLY